MRWQKATQALLFGEPRQPVWIHERYSVQHVPSKRRSLLHVLLPSDGVQIAVQPGGSLDDVRSTSQLLPEKGPW